MMVESIDSISGLVGILSKLNAYTPLQTEIGDSSLAGTVLVQNHALRQQHCSFQAPHPGSSE